MGHPLVVFPGLRSETWGTQPPALSGNREVRELGGLFAGLGGEEERVAREALEVAQGDDFDADNGLDAGPGDGNGLGIPRADVSGEIELDLAVASAGGDVFGVSAAA